MRHRGGAPNAAQLARAKKPKPKGPSPADSVGLVPFRPDELAFFWDPRPWLPDIRDRFAAGRPGSSDIRDAIIEADDEGGRGYLRWFKDAMTWGLTDAGKRFVEASISTRKIRKAREWTAHPKPHPKPAESVLPPSAGLVLPADFRVPDQGSTGSAVGHAMATAYRVVGVDLAVAGSEATVAIVARVEKGTDRIVVHGVERLDAVHDGAAPIVAGEEDDDVDEPAETPEEEIARLVAEQAADREK